MSAAADETAARIRAVIGHKPGVTEQKMFGGAAFMLNGNMVVGATGKGALMIRCDPARQAEALARPGAFELEMSSRGPMKGFVGVDGEEDDDTFRDWIAFAETYARTLPPKVKPAK